MLRAAASAFLVTLICVPARAEVRPWAWLEHAERDLSALWMRDELAGEPIGSFPTFLCADGTPFDETDPCPSLEDAGDWIKRELGRQYIRMVSRQSYTYGVIYHLTGNETALARARAGTRYIQERAWDPETGSVATFLVDGKPGLKPAQRTSQSLAYALLGPSFYYYLTRDQEVLEFIRSVRSHIFDEYWSEDWKMLKWNIEDAGEDTSDRMELVAQLDQINAYMLLMLPLLDEESGRAWENDLRRLVEVMLRDFFDGETHRFYGYVHDQKGKQWGERHNDFGHTAKGLWMLLLAGRRLEEDGWVSTAEAGIDDSLRAAFIRRRIADAPDWQEPVMRRAADENGVYYVWSNQPDGIGIPVWEWCELDQVAATMALSDPRYSEYVDQTYRTFFATLVDPLNGGTYGFPGHAKGPKAHQWQSGYHVAEHALVGYITSSMLRGESFRLYFAFPDSAAQEASPAYYFDAEESGRRAMERLDEGLRKTRVAFAPQ